MNEAGPRATTPKQAHPRPGVYAYTQDSAYAEFCGKAQGSCCPATRRTSSWSSRNLYTVAAPAILHTVVRETYVAGQQAFAGSAGSQ